MAWIVLVGLIGFISIGCANPRPDNSNTERTNPDEKVWIQLFNGQNLAGWDVKIKHRELNDNFGETFRVDEGIIKVSYDAYDSFSEDFGILIYEKPFSHYVVAVEYRFTGDQLEGGPGWALRNSGVMVHSQSAESMTLNQNFPVSIEVQLLGGTGEGERTTANLCTPGTNVVMDAKLITTHCINSKSKTYHGDDWVRVEIEVLGSDTITHLIDGENVLSYDQPQTGGGAVDGVDSTLIEDGVLLDHGYIGLQSESHPIEFRKVELLNLSGCRDERARNYKSYLAHADSDVCIYD